MSLLAFENLTEKYPDFDGELSQLKDWTDAHSKVRVLELRRLVRETRLSKDRLIELLYQLRLDGVLRHSYRVIDPRGNLLPDDYDRLDEIPATLHDRFDRLFETADGEVVSVFQVR